MPQSTLWFANLDSSDAHGEVIAAPDGSLVFVLPNNVAGDVLRLQSRDESGARSEPLDLVLPGGTPGTPSCLTAFFELIFREGVGTQGEILLESTCSGSVVVDSLSLRRNEPSFQILTVTPFPVPAGGTTAVTIEFDGSMGAKEDVLLMDSGSESGRVAVQLMALPDG